MRLMMRGKKVDTEFLGSFIMECVKLHKQSPDDFVSEAQDRINKIDAKIKEVEQLKAVRTKLLDVVEHFSTPVPKEMKSEQELVWYKIPHPHICKFICDSIKNSPVLIEDLQKSNFTEIDVLFCIKELLAHKVISRASGYLLRGDKYKEYTNSMFKEV